MKLELDDIHHLTKHQGNDRSAFELVADLEQELNFTMRPGARLVQIVEAHASAQREHERQGSLLFL